MTSDPQPPGDSDALAVAALAEPARPPAAGSPVEIQPHDFRNPAMLPPRDWRKLKLRQEDFVNALASRLSLFLRLEVTAKLAGPQTVLYQKLTQSWANPTHLTLFKIEPLRGVCILEIPPRLGSALVDRLMGGPGLPADTLKEFSEIEKALLEQAAQLVLSEWCGHWRGLKDLKPVILGQESNGRFVQTAPPETVMLVVSIETRIGQCAERMLLGFPYPALESLIRQLGQGTETMPEAAVPAAANAPLKWNSSFDDLCIPVTAEWGGMEVTAREVLALKVGDVLRMDSECAGHVQVRVAELPRFAGRPGTVAGKWAVELTRAIKH
jgi:flagellar motor switch protein FliM